MKEFVYLSICFLLSILLSMSVVAVIYSKASTRPDGFAPTTIRKYVLVHFVSESRIAVGPLELQKRIQTCFPVKILLIKETQPSPSYYEITMGISSLNASKHTSQKVLRSPEFPNVCISFKKGWKSVLLHFVHVNQEQVTIFGATSLAETNNLIQKEKTRHKLSIKGRGAQLGKNQNRKGWAIRPSARYFSLRNTLIACLIFNVISWLFRWEFPY